MLRTGFRNLSFRARDLPLHNHVLPFFSSSAYSAHSIVPRFFSSRSNLSNEVASTQAHNRDDHSQAEDVISNEELKKRISKLGEGDDGAVPEIFEGILSRILAGKPEEAHDELRKELFGEETESADDSEDLEFDLDEEDMSESDKE